MKLLLTLLALSLINASCSKPPETAESPPPRSHPWDWIPDDSVLLKGREIYVAECALCHNEGEESAPALTRNEEWAARETKGIDSLIKNAIKGFHGDDGHMPARGGSDYLTDDEVAAAVRYMIATTKQ